MGLFDFGFSFSRGGGTNAGMSKDLMQFQSDQWRGNTEWFNKNGYKFLRQGLIDADYNPILALSSGPLNGEMPNMTASEGTAAGGFNMSPSANQQANTAQKIANSQISVNNAQANKLVEEALSQFNYRENLDSQTALNNINAVWRDKSLPLELKLLASQVEVNKYLSANYRSNTAKTNAETKYVPKYYDLREKEYNLNKDTIVSEQKYREEHPFYNFIDRWSKAISPWAMPVSIGASASANSRLNTETLETMRQNFDRNGRYQGHSRTTSVRTKGRKK